MSKKSSEVFPQELRERFFPELDENETPSRAQLKEKILELHEGGKEEDAAELLRWNEKLKNSQATPALSKASKVVMFSLAVLAGILGVLWLIFESNTGTDSLVVCSVNGQVLEGDQCLPENIPADSPPTDSSKEESKQNSSSSDIFVGETD